MKCILLMLCTTITYLSSAQFIDGFDDGDYINNPLWEGHDSKFTVDNMQLRLQAPAVTSTAYLSTASNSINNAVWQFRVELDFNPSGSNLAQVFLVSDQSDLTAPFNGYFVLIGGTPDEISLYKQTGSINTKIIDGPGLVNTSTVNATIKVTRDDQGNWELLSDVTMSGVFTSQGTVVDNSIKASSFFGVLCTYTSTRADKFYFDDFFVSGGPFVDTEPPAISNIVATTDKTLQVQFDEPLEPLIASTPSNYVVNKGIGVPTVAALQSDNVTIVLNFDKPFINGVIHELEIINLSDLNGNAIGSLNSNFLYFNSIEPQSKDIIISEIFADPSPQLGLPDAEYVEIFNRSEHPFNLDNWKFTDGSSTGTFSSQIVLPGEYRVVTSNSNAPKFGNGSNIIGLPNFPTLNNGGDALRLVASNGTLLDSVNYDLSWYRDGDKEEGGWSLEIIDPNNICAEEENWVASENPKGGTPGNINSVFANKPDLLGPKLESVIVKETELVLFFNEKLESPLNPFAKITIEPNLTISHAEFHSKDLRSIRLSLETPPAPSTLYQISLSEIFDCSGNEIALGSNTKNFALPESAEEGDVIINEILFNPKPNGVDFVELYNTSDKYINLAKWLTSNISKGTLENSKPISSQDFIFYPKSYLVLTSDKEILKTNYPQGKEESFIESSLPNFPNDKGSVAISNDSSLVVDSFLYDKGYHSEFINDEEGVSLERISFSEATASPLNWKSASSIAGFATPGSINSNFRADQGAGEGQVNVEPEIFQPNSGINDFSKINFRFDQAGLIGNVKILDQEGRIIKILANNANLGFEGFFRWDGEKENGEKARLGYYIVWFEVFDNQGMVKTYRKRVVIASR